MQFFAIYGYILLNSINEGVKKMKMNLTQAARDELTRLDKGNTLFRVKVVNFSWSGVRFSIVIDEERDGDSKFEMEGYTFVISNAIYETFKRFSVDYIPAGLRRGFDIKGYPENENEEFGC